MKIIEIEPLENGAHDNFTTNDNIDIPEGWALIPDDMEIPETFPFVNITVAATSLGNFVVTSMMPGVVPPSPPQPEPEPTADEILDVLLGVTE